MPLSVEYEKTVSRNLEARELFQALPGSCEIFTGFHILCVTADKL